jgi:hypothetical protein
MRLAGTALICVLAAFGAAFLVGRAVEHQSSARAATTVAHKNTPVAAPVKPATNKRVNAELVSEFAPMQTSSLKHRPRPHRRHRRSPPPAASTAPTTSTAPAMPVQPVPVLPQPVYRPPASSGSSGSSSSGGSSSTHKKKPAGGSGTTTIG